MQHTGERERSFSHLHTKNDHFTKTGSGQTLGKLKKIHRFSQGPGYSRWQTQVPALPHGQKTHKTNTLLVKSDNTPQACCLYFAKTRSGQQSSKKKRKSGMHMYFCVPTGRHSNNSQFFLTFVSTPHLNGRHVVFGKKTLSLFPTFCIATIILPRQARDQHREKHSKTRPFSCRYACIMQN